MVCSDIGKETVYCQNEMQHTLHFKYRTVSIFPCVVSFVFLFFVLSVEPLFRHTLQSSKHTSLSTDFLSILFGYPRQMDSPIFTERQSPCELTNCKSTPICRGPHSVSSLQPHDMTTTPTGKAINKAINKTINKTIAKPKGKHATKAKRNPKKQKQRARRRMMQRKAEWQRQQPHHPPPSTTIIPSAIATTPTTTSTTATTATTATTTVPVPVTTTQTTASVPASVSARFVDIDLSDNDSTTTPPTTRLSSSTSSSISKPQRTASYSTLEDATDEHQLYDIIGYDDVGDNNIDDVNVNPMNYHNTPYENGENKNTEEDATSCIIC